MARGQSALNKRLKEEVGLLALTHSTASGVLNELIANADRLGIDSDDVPEERTIRRWLKEIRTSDTSPPWSPMAADRDQAERVLPVLREVVTAGGEKLWLSQDLATLVDQVVFLAPSIPPRWAWALARAYQWARANKTNIQTLDLTLTLRPWERVSKAITWAERLHELGEQAGGWIGGGPGLLALATTLPPPKWAEGDRIWGAALWELLTKGSGPLATDYSEVADSKLTAEPLDDGGQTETNGDENRRENKDFGHD